MHNAGRIELGRNTLVRSLGTPVRLVATAAGKISIGDGVLLDVGASIFSDREVRIGDRVTVGPNVTICDRDEHGFAGELVIEEGARIGAGAKVIGPCRIGREARVLAGSVVRADVADGTVAKSFDANGIQPATHAAPHKAMVNGAATTDARSNRAPKRCVTAALAADFTIDELAGLLARPDYDGLSVRAEVAPFDQVVPTLMTLTARDPKLDLAVVWTRPEKTSPSFSDLLLGGRPDPDRILEEVDAFASIVKMHSGAARFVFVPSWVLSPRQRGGGILAHRSGQVANLLMRMNMRLSDALSESPNVFLLDAQRWMAAATDGGFEEKLWYAGKVAFTPGVLAEAARDIVAALRGALGMSRKLVVVDLDDTLWGGIVGDVGWEGLQLGGHDPNGEAFVQFQKQLIALAKRGIALAVVSKNEESTALDAMKRHSEMVIRPETLAAFRINWRDKATNILEITKELNLGLQSVVFIDDNPLERGRVREALPDVYVPEWPDDPTRYPGFLDSLTCFDSAYVSAEDLERNAMYATERERTSLRNSVSSIDEWLATLGLSVRFEALSPGNASRTTQLLNKTNQMNLRTRRLTEAELTDWSREPGHELWAVHVSDRFGDGGLTGVLGLTCVGDDVHLSDFVLSCRVMGRRVEETMLWAAQRRAVALGGRTLVISPIATAKNKPCLDFFARSGLAAAPDGYAQFLDAVQRPPSLVTVEGLS